MMDIWSWICELPNTGEWAESDSPLVFELATSSSSREGSTRSIQLKTERTAGSNSDALVTFSVCLQGFHPFSAGKTLWVSDTCPLSSDKSFLPLVLQLLQDIISNSPTAQDSTCPRSQLQKLKPDPISWIMDTHSPESFSGFFNLVFLTRLFWLCAFDAPSEVGSLFFEYLLSPNLDELAYKHWPVLKAFLIGVGVDTELCFMRTVGYMITKWLILRDIGLGSRVPAPWPGHHAGFSYATEAHGLWVLKGYAPMLAMKRTGGPGNKFEVKDLVLKYALAHQQLEATVLMEYTTQFFDGYIQVSARVNNIRLHVVKLGYAQTDGMDYAEERHFVSRAKVWVGPEVGATYVGGVSLGRSTSNGEKEVELQRTIKNNRGDSKIPQTNTKARMSTRTRIKNWRWDQDIDGNAAVFDAVLYDSKTGLEAVTCRPIINASGTTGSGNGLRNRQRGPNRPFTKMGGLIFAADDYGESVEWRLSKEMEGSVLKWRIGGYVWVSYWPNEVKSSYFETRCVEWCDEVDLPLIPAK